MARVTPFHSTRPGEQVYHDNNVCTEGNNIERYYWQAGTGFNRRLCTRCADLDRQGR